MNKIKIIGIVSSIGTWIIMLYTFFLAYFNGNKIIVDINSLGEANFEMIFLPICFIISMIYFTRELKK